jgi:hypothetical protein
MWCNARAHLGAHESHPEHIGSHACGINLVETLQRAIALRVPQ